MGWGGLGQGKYLWILVSLSLSTESPCKIEWEVVVVVVCFVRPFAAMVPAVYTVNQIICNGGRLGIQN